MSISSMRPNASSPAPIQVSSATSTTTTSTADVLISGMTITPGAGNYLAWFSGDFDAQLPSTAVISLYVNGVQIAHTERQQSGTAPNVTALVAYLIGIGTGQAIEVRWRGTSTGKTITNYKRTFVIQKVS